MDSILMDDLKLGFLSPKIANAFSVAGSGSDGFIAGVVTENGIPVSRRVFCYHRISGRFTSATISDADGRYRFNGLVNGAKYFITSLDENNDSVQYNAVTQDLITASEVVR